MVARIEHANQTNKLRAHLAKEVKLWSLKTNDQLRQELTDVVAMVRDNGEDSYNLEVQLVEDTPDYVHVCVSVDDGSIFGAPAPANGIVHSHPQSALVSGTPTRPLARSGCRYNL
jgi:hypothetical protein